MSNITNIERAGTKSGSFFKKEDFGGTVLKMVIFFKINYHFFD